MCSVPPKKMLILNILTILRTYSDSNHRLSQQEIVDYLERDYQMTVDRKAVKRNLMNLYAEPNYGICCTEIERKGKNGETEILMLDWFIQHDFESSELRLLIDGILFSNQIPRTQRADLIKKIAGLSSRYFKSHVENISGSLNVDVSNKQLFHTIDFLDEAISQKRQVTFCYGNYGIDGRLHARKDSEGKERSYQASPYQMVTSNGRYYLLCSRKNSKQISSFRVDRILDIEIENEIPAQPLKELVTNHNGFDLQKHIAEHVYMFSGAPQTVRFRIQHDALNHVFDWFAGNVRFEDETSDDVIAVVRVNEQAMLYWALQFNESVEILSPSSLRNKLYAAGKTIATKYHTPNEDYSY